MILRNIVMKSERRKFRQKTPKSIRSFFPSNPCAKIISLITNLLHMVLRNVLWRGLSKLLTIRCMRLRWGLRTPRGPRRRGITGPISSRAGHLTTPARGPHLLHTRLVLRTLMPRASHGTWINRWRVTARYHRTHRSPGTIIRMGTPLALGSPYLHSGSHILATHRSTWSRGSNETTSSHGVSHHTGGSHAGGHTRLGRPMPLETLLLRGHWTPGASGAYRRNGAHRSSLLTSRWAKGTFILQLKREYFFEWKITLKCMSILINYV